MPAQERKTPGAKNTNIDGGTDTGDVNGELKQAELRSKEGQDVSVNTTQFVSHLDPSSDLMMVGSNRSLKQRIGLWVSKAEEECRYGGGGITSCRRAVPVPPTLDRFLLSHLNAMHAFEFPSDDKKKELLSIYFDYVDPILPIVDKNAFLSAYTRGQYSVPLLHAILMTAARHRRSLDILDHPRRFAVDCYRKIRGLLYAGIETNNLVLTRIYTLMSLHSEGPEAFKEGARNLAVAFHYGVGLGIHLRFSDATDHPTEEGSPVDNGSHRTSSLNLFWSMWCLDLCAACANGIPLKIHPRDMGVSLESAEDGPQGTLFKGLVRACQTLDAIIDLYRPNSQFNEVPEIVKTTSFPDDGTSFTALFRLIHYTSILLSYKRVSSMKDEDVSENLLSVSLDVYDLVEKYNDLVPLPIIPYAVSLTFAIFLRFFNRESVRTAWKRGCDILDYMANFWWAAEALSSMARSVFEKLEAELKQQEPETVDFDKYQVAENLPDGTLSSFMGQTSIFNELDPDVVDYWFPDTGYNIFD